MLELPAVLVHAIQDFAFTDKPLWRIGEGLQHVKVELTFKLPTNQPTSNDRGKKPAMSKRAESRKKKPAPPASEWSRQPLSAERPPKCHSVLSTQKPTKQPYLRQTAPPPTVMITSPAPPTVTYQRPPTQPSPTMPPAKKMPRLEPPPAPSQEPPTSPAPQPMKTKPVLRETKKTGPDDPTSIQLPPYNVAAVFYNSPVLDHYQVLAFRSYEKETIYMLKRKNATHKQQCFAKYDEPTHAVYMVFLPDVQDDTTHHYEAWREWKTHYCQGKPVDDPKKAFNNLINTKYCALTQKLDIESEKLTKNNYCAVLPDNADT